MPRWQWQTIRWREGSEGWLRAKFVSIRCWRVDGEVRVSPELGVADMKQLGALDFHNYNVEAHSHRHHV